MNVDPEALVRLSYALARFDETASDVVAKADCEVERVIDRLRDREVEALRQLDAARDELERARQDLRSCEAQPGTTDEEGNVEEPDCSFEESALEDARIEVDRCEEDLANVRKWIGRIEDASSTLRRAGVHLSSVTGKGRHSARDFLERCVVDIRRYQELAPPSASIGLSRHSTSQSPVQSTNMAALRKAMVVSDPTKVTADDMVRLKTQLKHENPELATNLITSIEGPLPDGDLSKESITATVQEFASFVHPALIRALPKLQIKVIDIEEGILGRYRGRGILELNSRHLLDSSAQGKSSSITIFHELGHWVHRDGPQYFMEKIKSHFEERTNGEEIARLPQYGLTTRDKRDSWYRAYAGRIYESLGDTGAGLEIPSMYSEWLAMTPEEMADEWKDPLFRETMAIVVEGFNLC